jgi:hypothetical protein
MSVVFPLVFPTHTGLVAFSISGHQVTGATTAPFSGVQQVQEHQGGWWEADFELPPMRRSDAMIWRAWLQSLRGRAGTFLMGDPLGAAPRGSAGVTPGTPQVDGAGQTGLTLAIKTGLGNVTGYLLAGDWIALGSGASRRLYTVINDADLAGGNTTLDIWPRLRASPNNNDAVAVADTTGLWRLVDPSVEFSEAPGDLWRLPPVSCREAL